MTASLARALILGDLSMHEHRDCAMQFRREHHAALASLVDTCLQLA